MTRLYLPNILRAMHYYACSTWEKSEPDEYMLQVVVDYEMVYHGKAHTSEELIEAAKKKKVAIQGDHWADYFVPGNGLEKRMYDDVKTLSSIVSKLVTLDALVEAGYSKSEAKKILKDAAYVIGDEA